MSSRAKMLNRVIALGLFALAVTACRAATDTPTGRDPRTTGLAAQPAVGIPGAGISGATRGATGSSGMLGNFDSPAMLLPMPVGGTGSDGGCRPATVAFVIDGSGSMCERFGNSTRWGELRAALVAKGTGLLYKIDGLATVGAYLYDGTIDLMVAGNAMMATMATAATNPTCAGVYALRKGQGNCPQILEVKPAMHNAANIDLNYPYMELGGSTPTDKVMNHVVDQMIAIRTPGQDLVGNPQFIILATDGQPNDICVGGLGGDGVAQQQGVVAAVDKATSMQITTYVISLASDPALQAHLDDVARHGNPKDPMARTFTPTNSADLISTLSNILGSAVGCVF